MQHHNQTQYTQSFINIDQHEIVTQFGKKLQVFFIFLNEKGSCVAFTTGIDGAVILKLYQVSFYHGVLVGGAYPNNYL